LAAQEFLGGLCMASLLGMASLWLLYNEPFPWLAVPNVGWPPDYVSILDDELD